MSCAPSRTASADTSGVTVRQVSTRDTSAGGSPSRSPTLSHSAAVAHGANRSRYAANSATVGMGDFHHKGTKSAQRHTEKRNKSSEDRGQAVCSELSSQLCSLASVFSVALCVELC